MARPNLTFDGSTLTVTGAMTMANAARADHRQRSRDCDQPHADTQQSRGSIRVTGGRLLIRSPRSLAAQSVCGSTMLAISWAGGTTSTYNASFGAANDVFC